VWVLLGALLLALAGCSKDDVTSVGPVTNEQQDQKVATTLEGEWKDWEAIDVSSFELYVISYPPPVKNRSLKKTTQDPPIVTNGGFEEGFAGWTTAYKGYGIVAPDPYPGGPLKPHPEWSWITGYLYDPYQHFYVYPPPPFNSGATHAEKLPNTGNSAASAIANANTLHVLYQDVILPAITNPKPGDLTLKFWIRWKNYSSGGWADWSQDMIVELRNPTTNGVLTTLFKASAVPGFPLFSGGGNASQANYEQMSFDISSFQGQTVRLHFDFNGNTRVLLVDLDDVEIVKAVTNQPPVADAGDDQTVECNVRSGALVTLDGSASYDPDGDPLTYTWKEGETILASGIQPTANVTLPLGTHDIVLTVDDGNGGTASATVTITVQDTTPPTITIQSSITAGTGAGATACGAVLTNEMLLSFASAEDICDGPTTVGLSGVPEGNAFPVGTTTITYTGTDAEGNTATATQNVTVVDNTLPKITAPPTVTAYTGPDAITCGTILNDLGEATASDNCSVASILNNAPADKFFPVGTTTITWTATDVAGNEATATQTITVVDNTPPKITIQSAVVAYTGSGATTCDAVVTDEMLLYFATAQDNCDGNVQVTLRDVPPGNVFPVGTHSITYVAVDAKGNEATAFQNVTVYDNTPPLITGVTATPNTLWPPNHKLVTVTVSVDASDNCGNFTSNILSVVSNEPDNGLGDGDTADDIQNIDGLTVQLRAERSGMGNGRVYTITVRCTDPSGNYTDKLVEVTVPRDKGKKK